MSPPGLDVTGFTIAHFVVMGIFALLAVFGILWGIRLKRRRRDAEEQFEAHREAADAPAAAAETPDEPEAPVPEAPAAPPHGAADGDITQLKGLGPKLATTLAGLGITRIGQIAAMDPGELDALDAQLGTFRGRPARDRWAEQARLLAAGDRAGYEAQFGRLGG